MMNLSDEIRKLQELHETGVLSDEEFAQAKVRVIGGQGEPSGAPALGDHLRRLEMETELERLDREWQIQRQRFSSRDRHGREQDNSPAGIVMMTIMGLFIIGFCIFMIVDSSAMGAPPIFQIFGIFMIVFVVIGVIASITSASRYQEAHTRYQQRRAELLERIKRQENRTER